MLAQIKSKNSKPKFGEKKVIIFFLLFSIVHVLTLSIVYILTLLLTDSAKIFRMFLFVLAPLSAMALISFSRLNSLCAAPRKILLFFKWLFLNIIFDALYITIYLLCIATIFRNQCGVPDTLGLELYFILPGLQIYNLLNLVLMFWGRRRAQKEPQSRPLPLKWWSWVIFLAGILTFIVFYVERALIF